jgi:quinol monooxygenase YgiN
MLIPARLKVVRPYSFWVFAFMILTVTFFTAPISAQDSAMKDRVYVVTHVDTLPGNGPGAKLLQQYAADSRKDKGAVRIELYVQTSRPNHFSMVEVWENQQAFEAHEAAAHTKKFREDIQPMLGSPFDERLHQIVE